MYSGALILVFPIRFGLVFKNKLSELSERNMIYFGNFAEEKQLYDCNFCVELGKDSGNVTTGKSNGC